MHMKRSTHAIIGVFPLFVYVAGEQVADGPCVRLSWEDSHLHEVRIRELVPLSAKNATGLRLIVDTDVRPPGIRNGPKLVGVLGTVSLITHRPMWQKFSCDAYVYAP